VYVDNKDIVWLSDFGANAMLCCTGTYECRVRRKRRSGRDYVSATINIDGLAEEIG
jgi:streptogramin lyase